MRSRSDGGVSTCPACSEPIPDPSSNTGSAATARFGDPSSGLSGFWYARHCFSHRLHSFWDVCYVCHFGPNAEHAGIAFDDPRLLQITTQSRQILAINLAAAMAGWLYWALMESSPWQATLGKRILGLRVTNLDAAESVLLALRGATSGRHCPR